MNGSKEKPNLYQVSGMYNVYSGPCVFCVCVCVCVHVCCGCD